MIFYDIKLTNDQFIECKIAAANLKSEQLTELIKQDTYIVKGDFTITGRDNVRIFLSELYAVDAAGNECRLVESEGIDYASLEEYIESLSYAYTWYAEHLAEREERELEYWQDRQAEWYDVYGRKA